MQTLSTLQPQVVLDVGANRGEWIQAARTYFPQASIHAFELVPGIFEKLKKNVNKLHLVFWNTEFRGKS